MKPARAVTRRYLPTSPFKPPPPAPPAEQFAPQDQVTHDKYGLGRVLRIGRHRRGCRLRHTAGADRDALRQADEDLMRPAAPCLVVARLPAEMPGFARRPSTAHSSTPREPFALQTSMCPQPDHRCAGTGTLRVGCALPGAASVYVLHHALADLLPGFREVAHKCVDRCSSG